VDLVIDVAITVIKQDALGAIDGQKELFRDLGLFLPFNGGFKTGPLVEPQ
jgi:hypothetical protein